MTEDNDSQTSDGTGSGRGGAMGTPDLSPDEASPEVDQEGNAVVSGGGLVGPDDDAGPKTAAKNSPSSQAP
jgi:hypothetical protein